MTDNEKIMLAGCAAGAAAATVPAVYGYVKANSVRPICDADFLRAENGGFVSDCGESFTLRGINLNDDFFYYKKDDLPFPSRTADVFAALESRFGRYGARQLAKNWNENFIAPSDLKYIRKLGANCVRIPLRYRNLYSKENCKGDPDFERLDFLVEKCKKAGIYVIFDMHSAPGFQNTDSACGKDEESVLFDSGKAGFDARNTAIRVWTQIAVHFKDEPAVAAYDLLNRPLNRVAGWEEKLDTLHKFYRRLYKAIRSVDERHTIIMEAVSSPDTLPDSEKWKGENVAFGLYSHFHTTFETDALISKVRALKSSGIPFIVCKIRSEENLAYSLQAMNDNGISWLAGDFKGCGSRSDFLFGANVEEADLVSDSYETIGEKWSKPLATKNFTENKEMKLILKDAFKYGGSFAEFRKAPKGKMKFKAKIGFHVVKGITPKNA